MSAGESGHCIPRNKGLGEVTGMGKAMKDLKKGDWVVFGKKQSGTWSSGQILEEKDMIKVDRESGPVNCQTTKVSSFTVYNMLFDFVDLQPGDWIVQNSTNSAVGQAVIMLTTSPTFKRISRVSESLGATHVMTYNDLEDKTISEQVKELTGGKDIQLLLNCVGGKATTQMLCLAGKNAHFVTYGAMAEEALSFPPSVFNFNNITAQGFWQMEWFKQKSQQESTQIIRELVKYMATGKFKELNHEIVKINGKISDQEATTIIRDAVSKVAH
ncbi:hypothetical protein BJ322DRAFT_999551 [Thelephora terrestris]|uniref:Alcohol dehydrogenase-like C-terminal domain-containing protein n=1 Tax=Thelephora terrestris TaxID=56493 RepID=A0A9P6LAM8_9AGAM|nr:hypothetical protein BJ322DRAFT_999551 [Thelephora terrestris]